MWATLAASWFRVVAVSPEAAVSDSPLLAVRPRVWSIFWMAAVVSSTLAASETAVLASC